jgi:hypothetical protein
LKHETSLRNYYEWSMMKGLEWGYCALFEARSSAENLTEYSRIYSSWQRCRCPSLFVEIVRWLRLWPKHFLIMYSSGRSAQITHPLFGWPICMLVSILSARPVSGPLRMCTRRLLWCWRRRRRRRRRGGHWLVKMDCRGIHTMNRLLTAAGVWVLTWVWQWNRECIWAQDNE